jgi:hypothetical protein
MKLFSIVVLSAVCTFVSALPKPTSPTAIIDVSRIRVVNSSMEKARFDSLIFNSSNALKDDKERKKKSLESHEMISFAREHANVAVYVAIAYAAAMVVKCE